jgi:PilZ domain
MKQSKPDLVQAGETSTLLDKGRRYRDDQRIPLWEPVILEGLDQEGKRFFEETMTQNVSREGMCVETSFDLKPGAVLQVCAPYDGFRSQARVAAVRPSKLHPERSLIGLKFLQSNKDWIIH